MNKYIFKDNYVIGYTKNTQKEFYIDIDMYDFIKNYPWKEDIHSGYVCFNQMPMHRLIIGQKHDLDSVEIIDHANRNRMDNRLENLRITTYQNNLRNRSVHKNNNTGVIGVCQKYKSSKGICYRAYIDIDSKKNRIMQFL